jgi:hypothetical protein
MGAFFFLNSGYDAMRICNLPLEDKAAAYHIRAKHVDASTALWASAGSVFSASSLFSGATFASLSITPDRCPSIFPATNS